MRPKASSALFLKLAAADLVAKYFWAPLLVLLAALLPRSAAADDSAWGLGPIELGNAYPLARSHISAAPFSPETARAGTIELSGGFSWSNTFNIQKTHYRIDAETRTLELGAKYSRADDLEISLDVPVEYRGAGILDSAIDHWHQFFHLPRGGRNDRPADQFVISGINKDQSEFSFEDQGTRLGSIAVGVKKLLVRGAEDSPAVAGILRLGLPTGSGGFSHEGLDFLAAVGASRRMDRLVVYGSAAYLYYSDVRVENVELQRHHGSASLTAEYELTPALSGLAGLTYYSNIARSIENFPDYSLYLDVGVKLKSAGALVWEVLLRENPSPRLGSTDVTLHLGASLAFGGPSS